MNDAETCRQNGWVRGQYLRGDEGHGPEIIQITAVGDEGILARLVYSKGKAVNKSEGTWTLSVRGWEPVYKIETPAREHLAWRVAMARAFKCPECGSYMFGSFDNGDGTRTYTCSGNEIKLCGYKVHEYHKHEAFTRV